MNKKFVSVVLPSLNEELTVGNTIKRIKDSFDKYNIEGEIILVDASSKDKTVEIARNLGVNVYIVPKVGLFVLFRSFSEDSVYLELQRRTGCN